MTPKLNSLQAALYPVQDWSVEMPQNHAPDPGPALDNVSGLTAGGFIQYRAEVLE